MAHEEYKIKHFEKKHMRHGMKRIQSQSHQLGIYEVNNSFIKFWG